MTERSRTVEPSRLNHNGEAGFTLVEMLVVLAIIGMITALVGPQVMNYLGRAKVDTARVEVQNYDLYSQGPDGTSDGAGAEGAKSW
jgi:general secretion pathway protein G